jgi:hypothetical protein|nr:MAG TPA_asm: hypothetical protein [Caudoviricetes sp.]
MTVYIAGGITGVVATMGDDESSVVSNINGVAIATGRYGRATAAGERGVALATSYHGVAKAEEETGVAVATGVFGAASAEGAYGVAMTTATGGMVRGKIGCALIAIERLDGSILHVAADIVDGVNIKPDTWYTYRCGKLVEVER